MISAWLSPGLFAASVILYARKAGRHKGWFSAILPLLLAYIMLNATLLASNYFTGEGINDAVLYTLTSSLSGAGAGKYLLPAAGLLLLLILLLLLLGWLLRQRNTTHYSHRWSLLALVLALASITTTPACDQVSTLVKSQLASGNSDFYNYYQIPTKTLPAGQRPNLIYIYAESLERTYFNRKAFPDLLPELAAIKDKSLDFSNTEQLPGTEYTIAGIVASQCGIPLFAPFDGNASSALSTFYPRSVCLGDILKASGYQNYFFQGASLRFAGKDTFLSSHGIDYLYGFDELKPQVKNPGYRNDWGWYDDTVLAAVFAKYQELSGKNQPFALFALTVDTHHPDGFISQSCARNRYSFEGKDNQTLAAVSCSQQHIAALIEKIKRSPGFRNTIIVVSSDHLAMNNTAFKYLNQHQRRNLFFMLRGGEVSSLTITAKRNTMDNGATVLDAMGGDNFIGLGRSSLSSTSLSATWPNLREKIIQWKPNIVKLWHLPQTISAYQADTNQNTFSFEGVTFNLPLLLAVKKEVVEPHFDVYMADPLKAQLSQFAPGEKFVWIDRCYKMGNVWNSKLSTVKSYCLASGMLNGNVQVIPLPEGPSQGRVSFPAAVAPDRTRYLENQRQLRMADKDLKYPGDTLLFFLPGLPQTVSSVSGLSGIESWGRWSDANIAPEVRVRYARSLPARFTLTLTARAFGENVRKPMTISVGGVRNTIRLSDDIEQLVITLDNPDAASEIVIIPPAPTITNEGFNDGSPTRRLGVGLVSMQITPSAE